ncbi:MAG: Txe/YoeB family addiction module toxin [Chitinophagaceae bacterium]|nr:Txe/YoeB family addiction module toxin [Chitinophagaceae bacterium]
MRDIRFTPTAFEQYNQWLTSNKSIYTRLNKLILETARTPFEGTGKPEALKHDLKGYWSRRINDEHRRVYRVENDYITIIACKFHYT